jgi:hypothetical protein
MNLLQSLLKMEKPSISQEITISTEKGKDRTTYRKKIYKASLENDKWVNITELPLTVIITVQHPILMKKQCILFLICREL